VIKASEFETEALQQLPSLLSVATRLTRRKSDSEDLVQDTFVKAIRARSQYQPGTNMRAWLLKILTNTFINRYRRGVLERNIAEEATTYPLADGWMSTASMAAVRDPESAALRPMLEAEIGKALDDLPEEFRLAVVLSDVEDLSYKEISDVMGCPIGTVMSRLHRGRRMLKARLFEHAHDLGILGDEAQNGQDSDRLGQAPVDLEQYRSRKARTA